MWEKWRNLNIYTKKDKNGLREGTINITTVLKRERERNLDLS